MIIDAHERIRKYVYETPLIPLRGFGDPGQTLGKAECFQHTGSFKFRGALNRVLIAHELGVRTIVTASTGNHGRAVAAACSLLNLPCRIYVPDKVARAASNLGLSGPQVDVVSVSGDPAEIEVLARKETQQLGEALFVSPYNDIDVVAGQGTIGLELLAKVDCPPDSIYVSAGGGGLVSGIAAAVKPHWPQTRIVACFPDASPVLARAVHNGYVTSLPIGETIATGIAGNIESDTITLDLCRRLVNDYTIVGEHEIEQALLRCLIANGIMIEGATAVALAAISQRRAPKERSIAILCGRNISRGRLSVLLGREDVKVC